MEVDSYCRAMKTKFCYKTECNVTGTYVVFQQLMCKLVK